MSRFNIVKKCLDAMNTEQQDQIIDNCVSIVTNGSSRSVAVSAKTKRKPDASLKAKARTKTSFIVRNEEYKSFSSFCKEHDLKKATVYAKYRKIKTAKGKIKFLDSLLDS